ncbi:P-loop NTPase [Paenibacillus sp. 453mf]|uniref:P-loop NTPase n=1 Tax=Paenibacillus sp. 453mf TaxID=1761874 RepID=UPI0008EEB429|nr:P-loop NTPase [Paenibacillus sp. 453mf]SFS55400.1 ATP-binding protein involved in chromosome partitioning [Paenibacillus sp. 453mf]
MTKDEIEKILQDIRDTDSDKSILEKGLIRDIVANSNMVALTLLTSNYENKQTVPYKKEIENELTKAGVHNFHIRIKLINEQEQQLRTDQAQFSQTSGKKSALLNNTSLLGQPALKFIAIASGKGGVGKSTITLNLAAALNKAGKRVGIIDADIYGFSIPNMLGIKQKPKSLNNSITPVESNGMHIMSTDFFVKDNNPVIWRGPRLGKMLSTFVNNVEWPVLDYMIIDMPPGTGDIALSLQSIVPEYSEIIVTTPASTASEVAARAGAMAIQTKHHLIGVIENMSFFEDNSGQKHYLFGRNGGIQLAKKLQTQFLGQLEIISPEQMKEITPSHFSPIFPSESRNGDMISSLADHIIRL